MKLVKVGVANMVIKQKLPLSTCWPTHSLVRTSIWSEFKRETRSFHVSAPSVERPHNYLTVWTGEARRFAILRVNILGGSKTKGISQRCKAKSLPRVLDWESFCKKSQPPCLHTQALASSSSPWEYQLAFLNHPTFIPNHTLFSWYPSECHLWMKKTQVQNNQTL